MNREMKFEEYEPFLKENEQAMTEALQKLIRFNTEQAEPVTTKDGEVYPFGQGVQDCFEVCLELARGLGFETCNVDNYGGNNEPTKSVSINHIQAGREMPVYVVK